MENVNPQMVVSHPDLPLSCTSSNIMGSIPSPPSCDKDGSSSSSQSFIWNHAAGTVMEDATGNPISVDSYLGTKPLRSDLSTRPGPGGRKLTYMSGDVVTRTLNEAFGHNGWSFSVLSTTLQHSIDLNNETAADPSKTTASAPKPSANNSKPPKWQVTYVAHVRISLASTPNCFREDYGIGDSIDKHLPTAMGNALKASITDGMKRAARLLGDKLGNSLYGSSFALNKAPNTLAQALQDYQKQKFDVQRHFHPSGMTHKAGPNLTKDDPSAVPASSKPVPGNGHVRPIGATGSSSVNLSAFPKQPVPSATTGLSAKTAFSVAKDNQIGGTADSSRGPPFATKSTTNPREGRPGAHGTPHPPRVSDVAAQVDSNKNKQTPTPNHPQLLPAQSTSFGGMKRNAAQMVTPSSVLQPNPSSKLQPSRHVPSKPVGGPPNDHGPIMNGTKAQMEAASRVQSTIRHTNSDDTHAVPSVQSVPPVGAPPRVSDINPSCPQTAAQSMQPMFGGLEDFFQDDDEFGSVWDQRPSTSTGQRSDVRKKPKVIPTTNPYQQ